MVSVFENCSPQVQRTFHYDPEHHSANRVDIKLLGSDTHTMMAKYNENLDISLIYDEVTTESNGTKLLYENEISLHTRPKSRCPSHLQPTRPT